jgi:hypothetical protein
MAICGSRRAAGNPTPTLYRPLSCETGLNEKGNLAEKQPYPPPAPRTHTHTHRVCVTPP